MFGLFKKSPSPRQEPLLLITFGEDGRPRPPHFSELQIPENATHDQRILALKWSILWRREQGVTPDELVEALDQVLSGVPLKRRAPFREVVSMAVRAIRISAQKNRAARAKRALPWIQFRLGPQECPCVAAQKMADQFRTVDEGFQLPLIGCDQDECLCWTIQKASRTNENAPKT
jgi:hypothetical protein